MKLGKYILGLALVAVGLTSCDQENVGAMYEPTVANISFLAAQQSTLTDKTSIEVPVAIGRATTNGEYTANVTMTGASEGVSLKSNQVTFANGEGIAYATVVVTGMEQGTSYSCTVNLSDADKETANKDFGKQISSTNVTVMCDYNWVSAGTCTFVDYTWEDGYAAENVPIVNAEGTNIYRIKSPLAYVYDSNYVDGRGDTADFEFNLNADGSITVPDGTPLNYWGYLSYFDSAYPSYCYVEQDGNTYGVHFLLLNGEDLYTGGYFEFTWNK